MNIELNPSALGQSLSRFLHRFHVVVFVVTVIGGLAVATYLLMLAMNPPESDEAITARPRLDTATIERVNNLSNTPAPLQIPANKRTNPF